MATYHLSKAMSEETQNKVARTSNAVGTVAGIAGLGSAATAFHAMRKTPGAQRVGGPLTRRVGARMPKSRAGKLALAGAGGALALQAGNVIGDAVTSQVLARADRDTKTKNKALRESAVSKARKSFNTPDSAWIEGADYNTRTKTLTMRTRRGDTYDYPKTPRKVYRKMNRSESVGEFYNKNLKLQPVQKSAVEWDKKRPKGVKDTYSGSAASGAATGAKAMLPMGAAMGALGGAATYGLTRAVGGSHRRAAYSGIAQGAKSAGKLAALGAGLGAGAGLMSRKHYGRSDVNKALALPPGKSAVRNSLRNRAVNHGRILATRARTAPRRVDRAAQRLGDKLGAAKMTSWSPDEAARTAMQNKAEKTMRGAYAQHQQANRMRSQAQTTSERMSASTAGMKARIAGSDSAEMFNTVRQQRNANYTRNKRLLGYGVPAAAAVGAAAAGEQIHEKVRKANADNLTPRQQKAKSTLKASQVSMGANLAGVAGLGLMAASPLVARKNKALGTKLANARNVTGAVATGGFSTAGLMNYKRAKQDARDVGVAKYYDPEVNRERRMRAYEATSAAAGTALAGATVNAGVKAQRARQTADATRSAAHTAANNTWQREKRAAWAKYPEQAADARILRTNDKHWLQEAAKAKTTKGTPYKNPKKAPIYGQMKADAAKNADDMVRRARSAGAAAGAQASARRNTAVNAANKAHKTATTARRFIKPGLLGAGAVAAGGAAIAANKYRKTEFGADGRAGGW